MSLAMPESERQEFLAGLHVGVLSIPRDGRGPLTAPIWYDYTPGGLLWFLTGPDSRKGRLLAEGVMVSLCAQEETPPYKYVVAEGPVVSVEPCDRDRDTRPMAQRYLGREMGDAYVEGQGEADGSVLVKVNPRYWLSVDYSRM